MVKKILLGIMLIVITLALAACGDSSENETQPKVIIITATTAPSPVPATQTPIVVTATMPTVQPTANPMPTSVATEDIGPFEIPSVGFREIMGRQQFVLDGYELIWNGTWGISACGGVGTGNISIDIYRLKDGNGIEDNNTTVTLSDELEGFPIFYRSTSRLKDGAPTCVLQLSQVASQLPTTTE